MKTTMHVRTSLFLFALASAACGGSPKPIVPTPIAVPAEHHDTPTQPSGPDLSAIPPPGEPKPLEPAQVTSLDLKSKVKALAITSKSIPVVHCRFVVRAGNATASLMRAGDKSRAGIANLTAELMKDGGAGRFNGRELADRVDALGADLTVEVGPDRVVFGLGVTKDKLDAALEILASVVAKPRFDAGEFAKLKARELDRVKQSQKGSGSWAARLALYRELYGETHPYGEVDATESTLGNIELADVKAFYKKVYVASNMFVVVAGDVDGKDLVARLDKHMTGVSAAAAPTITFGTPAAASERKVILATKPNAKQADVFVGSLAIPRKDERWPELALAVHSLGGGMASRLFVDVREKRSLAYSTNAGARELANGPSLLSLYAGTQTPKAPESVVALLENLTWISGDKPVTEAELAMAKTSLETGFVFRLETIGSVASLAIDKEILGLPGNDVYDYVAKYRAALHDAPLAKVRTIASERLTPKTLVIAVAGDAALAKSLARFGPVRVVDPEKGFATTAQLPADPNAPLEVGK